MSSFHALAVLLLMMPPMPTASPKKWRPPKEMHRRVRRKPPKLPKRMRELMKGRERTLRFGDPLPRNTYVPANTSNLYSKDMIPLEEAVKLRRKKYGFSAALPSESSDAETDCDKQSRAAPEGSHNVSDGSIRGLIEGVRRITFQQDRALVVKAALKEVEQEIKFAQMKNLSSTILQESENQTIEERIGSLSKYVEKRLNFQQDATDSLRWNEASPWLARQIKSYLNEKGVWNKTLEASILREMRHPFSLLKYSAKKFWSESLRYMFRRFKIHMFEIGGDGGEIQGSSSEELERYVNEFRTIFNSSKPFYQKRLVGYRGRKVKKPERVSRNVVETELFTTKTPAGAKLRLDPASERDMDAIFRVNAAEQIMKRKLKNLTELARTVSSHESDSDYRTVQKAEPITLKEYVRWFFEQPDIPGSRGTQREKFFEDNIFEDENRELEIKKAQARHDRRKSR